MNNSPAGLRGKVAMSSTPLLVVWNECSVFQDKGHDHQKQRRCPRFESLVWRSWQGQISNFVLFLFTMAPRNRLKLIISLIYGTASLLDHERLLSYCVYLFSFTSIPSPQSFQLYSFKVYIYIFYMQSGFNDMCMYIHAHVLQIYINDIGL